MLEVGDPAPEFEAKLAKGGRFRLSEALRTHEVLLYFFPKSFTPTCTRQSEELRDRDADLRQAGVRVVAVSPDGEDVTRNFCQAHALTQDVVLDPEGHIAEAYGANRAWGWLPNRRITYRIGKDGRITGHHHGELSLTGHLALIGG